ncbi:MAG: hypothetical protein ABIW49_02435 [Knoellia sp.]
MTAAIGLATATTAAAHECYNASRSDQGNLKAGTQSNTWFTRRRRRHRRRSGRWPLQR